jgi:large subunit ribosomal protein L3
MARGLLGKKLGMTQIFTEDGTRLGCTVLEVGPCFVVQKKEKGGKDGYDALKLAYEDVPERKLTKPELGVFKTRGLTPKRYVREVRVDGQELAQYEVGQELRSTMFGVGDAIDVVSVSKGRGFTGVMRRHNFSGGKASHGVHEYFRHGGSLGTSAWPSRVVKGRKMAGQHGNRQCTILNLEIVRAHPELNLLIVKGAVAGPANGLVFVRSALKIDQEDRARAAR